MMEGYKHWGKWMLELNIKKLEDSKIYIFGAGQRGIELYYYLRINGYGITGFVDNDIQKRGEIVDGILCDTIDCIKDDKNSIVFIANARYGDNIRKQLEALGYTNIYTDIDIYHKIRFNNHKNMDQIIELYNDLLYDVFLKNEGRTGRKVENTPSKS